MKGDPTVRSPAGEHRALLRVPHAAALLGISPRMLYQWLVNGTVPHGVIVHSGRSVYLKRRALEEWLTSSQGGAEPLMPR
jgi:excisionase family DNA binding protein